MSKPLTMTVEQEAAWRAVPARGRVFVSRVRDLWAEVDALRAALAAAEAKLADAEKHADRLNAALAEFGEHSNWCFGNPCDCPTGLAIAAHAARRAAEVAPAFDRKAHNIAFPPVPKEEYRDRP